MTAARLKCDRQIVLKCTDDHSGAQAHQSPLLGDRGAPTNWDRGYGLRPWPPYLANSVRSSKVPSWYMAKGLPTHRNHNQDLACSRWSPLSLDMDPKRGAVEL